MLPQRGQTQRKMPLFGTRVITFLYRRHWNVAQAFAVTKEALGIRKNENMNMKKCYVDVCCPEM